MRTLAAILSLFTIIYAGDISSKPANSSNIDGNKASDILSSFTGRLKSLPAFELEFSMGAEGAVIAGTIQSQKNSFRLINDIIEIYCDGKEKWIFNKDYNEVTIFKHDTSQTDITENPAAFFNTIGTNFSYDSGAKSWTVGQSDIASSKGNAPSSVTDNSPSSVTGNAPSPVRGKQLWLIELKPKNKKLAYSSITLGIEKETFIPVMISYLSKDGSRLITWVTRFGEHKEWPAEHFVFPADSLQRNTVNDLR
ncbi:MAG: outer membrane lipoprotein carrier protein LolA [Bacteroidales bacterium]|nr:outer membrane lipoprotein carrier protein LolA [Bacteroidales bacterium]MDD2426072.1 outer membrane lipoprotein carrier protein LolA [Bacteroidales bacterium]MDD3990279.1 outer membrane lipoprotein carrier protein LolA [Bacteroidales bacterium]MDD4639729.1 outer membrane lipoprotein carrier protein LolA [Bacteroidales bacterium]